ncbi:MAG: hypothetical protein JW854_16730 [Actinobacteria bacterium]|nr:hypothetical protein [Actinomycetota bacterium]
MFAFMGGFSFFFVFILPLLLANELTLMFYARARIMGLWRACFGGPEAMKGYLEHETGMVYEGAQQDMPQLLDHTAWALQWRSERYRRIQRVYSYVVALPGIIFLLGLYVYVFVSYVILGRTISFLSLGFIEALPGVAVLLVVALLLPGSIIGNMAEVAEKMKNLAQGEMLWYQAR